MTPFVRRVEEAKQFLQPLFADGQARLATEVLTAAQAAGFSPSSVHRAKDQMFVRAVRRQQRWYWEPQKNEVKV